jgi:RHS repeat-associated protein
MVVTVYPDADDTITYLGGIAIGGNGADGTYDRAEVNYDEVSNVTFAKEPREVAFVNTFDPGNRLTEQNITLQPGVEGETRRVFIYDELNRLELANNDYAQVTRVYDDLSRMEEESQYIRLDGTGFTNGWQYPIKVGTGYDKQSNPTDCTLVDGVESDLYVSCSYDPLNRMDTCVADYFGTGPHQVNDYDYIGPWRVRQRLLGNGAIETHTYDAKRRMYECDWRDAGANILVAFRYGTSQSTEGLMGYDKVDNPLNEQFLYDNNLYDNYNYNARYELTGVDYRNASFTDYRVGGTYASYFNYDDNFNRTDAYFADPFNNETVDDSSYSLDLGADPFNGGANEYASITRDSGSGPTVVSPAYDRAGNMTGIPLRHAAGAEAGVDAIGIATYDAFNHVFTLTAGRNKQQHYRYDAFGRRVATMKLGAAKGRKGRHPTVKPKVLGSSEDGMETAPGGVSGGLTKEIDKQPSRAAANSLLGGEKTLNISTEQTFLLNTELVTGRRYIHGGWSVVEERVFDPGATLADAPSTLERIYVNGSDIDSPILCAIDLDGDGMINDTPTMKNPTNGVGATDFEYYYAQNRLGSVMALLDADNDERVLEYYRYSVFGEATVLPVVDVSPVDGLEDTPLDLADNNALMLSQQPGAPSSGRFSKFRNFFMFTARRLDSQSGLYYYRHRYYEPRMGKFVGRDPAATPWRNLYGYCRNAITSFADPSGLLSVGYNPYPLRDLWWPKHAAEKKRDKAYEEPMGLVEDTELNNMKDATLPGNRVKVRNHGRCGVVFDFKKYRYGSYYDGERWISGVYVKLSAELRGPCCCDKVRMIQLVRFIKENDKGNYVSDEPDSEERKELSGWDGPKTSDRGWWVDETSGGTNPNISGSEYGYEGKRRAVMYDAPGFPPRGSRGRGMQFITCAICHKSNGGSYVIGCVKWGFYVDENGKRRIFQPRGYSDKSRTATDFFKKVTDRWNAYPGKTPTGVK